jgi:hypothetical protein
VAHNLGDVCAECRLIVANLFRERVEEKWRDLGDGKHVVSEHGRIARLLKVDRSLRYPRVSIGGKKVYLHVVVATAWHGPRPEEKLALHWDDDPDNPRASNLRWGTPTENAADAKRNGRIRDQGRDP